jgi:hypothetical protein
LHISPRFQWMPCFTTMCCRIRPLHPEQVSMPEVVLKMHDVYYIFTILMHKCWKKIYKISQRRRARSDSNAWAMHRFFTQHQSGT